VSKEQKFNLDHGAFRTWNELSSEMLLYAMFGILSIRMLLIIIEKAIDQYKLLSAQCSINVRPDTHH